MICIEKRGWVCRENAFFILEIFRATHRAGLGGGYIPQRWSHSPSAPGQPAQHRQQGRPRHAPAHTPGRWTRYTGLHPIPDRQCRTDRTCGGCWRAGSVSGKVYNFGRSILSIFIWICFVKSIDNPYIYGYNIISPDKYGLQPQYTKTGGQKP